MIEPGPCVVRNNVISFAHEPVENTMRSNAFGLGGAGGVQMGADYVISIPNDVTTEAAFLGKIQNGIYSGFELKEIDNFRELKRYLGQFRTGLQNFVFPYAKKWGMMEKDPNYNWAENVSPKIGSVMAKYNHTSTPALDQIGVQEYKLGYGNSIYMRQFDIHSDKKKTSLQYPPNLHVYIVEDSETVYIGMVADKQYVKGNVKRKQKVNKDDAQGEE